MAGGPNFHNPKEWDDLFERVAKLEKENADLRELLTLALVMGSACSLEIMRVKNPDVNQTPLRAAISNFMEEHGLKYPESVDVSSRGVVFHYEEENTEQADQNQEERVKCVDRLVDDQRRQFGEILSKYGIPVEKEEDDEQADERDHPDQSV